MTNRDDAAPESNGANNAIKEKKIIYRNRRDPD